MDNYVTAVFGSDKEAFAALHALWDLDETGDITVHGAAVVHRDADGHIDVATKQTNPGLRTALGVAIGTLLGALAGPAGAAAGASIAAGSAIGIGAAAGGVVGLAADTVKSDEHDQAAFEAGFVMRTGQAAVIADVSEDTTTPVDTAMKDRGGTVYRGDRADVRYRAIWGNDYAAALYPYDYDPHFT